MRFYCKLIMEGDFSGSPDTEQWEITEKTFDWLKETMGNIAIGR